MTDEEKRALMERLSRENPLIAAVMQEAAKGQRALRGLVRDHLREKGGTITVNGVEFKKGDIPEEH